MRWCAGRYTGCSRIFPRLQNPMDLCNRVSGHSGTGTTECLPIDCQIKCVVFKGQLGKISNAKVPSQPLFKKPGLRIGNCGRAAVYSRHAKAFASSEPKIVSGPAPNFQYPGLSVRLMRAERSCRRR